MEPDKRFIGRLVDRRYRLTRLIGRGAFGTVYQAFHERLEAPFAVKFLAANIAANPKLLSRFEREAKTTCQLRHPNIVDVVDYGEDPTLGFYLVMEFLDGESLKERLMRVGALRSADARRIGLQIAEALRVAHDRGVIHRDLKPANVMLLRDEYREDHVKLCDFGVAGLIDDGGARLTMTGVWLGTPNYMSPEQWEGREIDERSDLYGLGVLFYEMVTGRVPFVADSTAKLLLMHANEPPPPPRVICPGLGIHPLFESIVLRCLAKDKADRFQSAAQVIDQLGMLPQGGLVGDAGPLAATRPGNEMVAASTVMGPTGPMPAMPWPSPPTPVAGDPAGETGPEAVATGAETGAPQPPRRRRILPLVVGGGAAALVATLVLVLVTGTERGPAPGGPIGDGRAAAEGAAGPMGEPAATSRDVGRAAAAASATHVASVGGDDVGAEDTTDGRRDTSPGESPGAPAAADPREPDAAARPSHTAEATTPRRWSLEIESSPGGATVWLDGRKLGRAPLRIDLDASRRTSRLVLARKGYEKKVVTLEPASLAREGTTRLALELEKELYDALRRRPPADDPYDVLRQP